MVSTVVKLVMKDDSSSVASDSRNDLENQSLGDLMELNKMYMTNLKFHKDNGTLSSEREQKLITKIDYIMDIIESRSGSKKRGREVIAIVIITVVK